MKILPTKRRFFGTDIIFYIMLVIQVCLWTFTNNYKPTLGIVPDVPSKLSVKALSLGDEQTYFRILGYELQNAGDSFGRFTALKLYDYNKLYHWFSLLDTLSPQSHYIPSMASYYYSQTQNTPDVIHVINYLDEHASADLYHKWWWMSQAVYLAKHKLENDELALKLAYKLASTPRDDIPLWAKQMPAFILEKQGEMDQALMIIADILDNVEEFDQGELNFMHHFVTERLGKIVEEHPELAKLIKSKDDN
tara:strand:- start:634 stop:1383 length:750 start_codon:yes stop_codon:yes gene_type:complete